MSRRKSSYVSNLTSLIFEPAISQIPPSKNSHQRLEKERHFRSSKKQPKKPIATECPRNQWNPCPEEKSARLSRIAQCKQIGNPTEVNKIHKDNFKVYVQEMKMMRKDFPCLSTPSYDDSDAQPSSWPRWCYCHFERGRTFSWYRLLGLPLPLSRMSRTPPSCSCPFRPSYW